MTTGKRCGVCKIATLVAGIGALNWGLVALFNFNLVTRLLGEMSTASRIAYIVVGVAGLMQIASLLNLCPCQKGTCDTSK